MSFTVPSGTLSHLYSMHTFSTPWKHQKTIRKTIEKGCIGNKWIKWFYVGCECWHSPIPGTFCETRSKKTFLFWKCLVRHSFVAEKWRNFNLVTKLNRPEFCPSKNIESFFSRVSSCFLAFHGKNFERAVRLIGNIFLA